MPRGCSRGLVVIGSYFGATNDPAWVHNLRANPRARVEIGGESYDVLASELHDQERHDAVDRNSTLATNFVRLQAVTERTLPLFRLKRDIPAA